MDVTDPDSPKIIHDPLDTPEEPAAEVDEPEPDLDGEWLDEKPADQGTKKAKDAKPTISGPDTKALYKEYDRAIGPLCRLVDRIAGQVDGKGSEHHKTVQEHLNYATEEMMEWMEVQK